MDEHVMMNIMRFADPPTAIALMKVGGLFKAAKRFDMVTDIDYSDGCYFDITFHVTDKAKEPGIMHDVKVAFGADALYPDFQVPEFRSRYASMLTRLDGGTKPTQGCFMVNVWTPKVARRFKASYAAILQGLKDVAVLSTNRATYLEGLRVLMKLHAEGCVVLSDVALLHLPPEKIEWLKRNWCDPHKWIKSFNVRLDDECVLPIREVLAQQYSGVDNSERTTMFVGVSVWHLVRG